MVTVSKSKCDRSNYLSRDCGKIVLVGLIMAGIVFGAMVMDIGCVVCHLVKRRSASIRSQQSTKRLLSEADCTGTPGYVDPQYHQNFHLSDKSDVYSFDVVLVEIITAMKAVDFSRGPSEYDISLLDHDIKFTLWQVEIYLKNAIQLSRKKGYGGEKIGKGCVDDIVDPFLDPHRDAWMLTSIHKVAELAFRCLAFHSEIRPSMAEVADEVEQIQVFPIGLFGCCWIGFAGISFFFRSSQSAVLVAIWFAPFIVTRVPLVYHLRQINKFLKFLMLCLMRTASGGWYLVRTSILPHNEGIIPHNEGISFLILIMKVIFLYSTFIVITAAIQTYLSIHAIVKSEVKLVIGIDMSSL
uniref:Uncharacterized protein n=1 Tax=Aegilops tauschii TaxID=37682 RepID=M8BWY4_AEGTA